LVKNKSSQEENLKFCAAELMFGLVELELELELQLGGRGGNPNFFLCLSSSLVNLSLHTENQLCIMLGSALTVCVVDEWVVVNSEFSDRFGLALA
jgi:hypothetical protein